MRYGRERKQATRRRIIEAAGRRFKADGIDGSGIAANGSRAGKEFLGRLKERTTNRDKAISLKSYFAQLAAIHRWGLERPHYLSVIGQPVLVANGESDRMVPTRNSLDLARRLPDSDLVIYPDAGHGGRWIGCGNGRLAVWLRVRSSASVLPVSRDGLAPAARARRPRCRRAADRAPA